MTPITPAAQPDFLVTRAIVVKEGQACYSAYEPATANHTCLYDRGEICWGEIGTDKRTGEALARAAEKAHAIILAAFPEAAAGRKVGVRIWYASPELVELAARRDALQQEIAAVEGQILSYGAERELTDALTPAPPAPPRGGR